MKKTERNNPCPCGSGKKYKQCCLQKKSPSQSALDQLVALFNSRQFAAMEIQAQALLKQYPDDGFTWKALGAALQMQGKESLPALQKAAYLLPQDAEAHFNLGKVLREQGQAEKAVASYHHALELNPKYFAAHSNLGNALRDLGQFDAAVASYRSALAIKPDYAEAHNNLALAYQSLGNIKAALTSCRQALAHQPNFAEAHNNLGNLLKYTGEFSGAIKSYRQALLFKPDYAEAHNNLGNILIDQACLTEAVEHLQQALRLKPNFAAAFNNLGSALKDQGLLNEAIECFIQTLSLQPELAQAMSNLLFVLNYHPDLAASEIFRAYQDYDAQWGIPLRSTWRQYENDRNPDRRLRIAYVSPDFRNHSTRSFLEPLLAQHDKTQVEVVAYAELSAEDTVTHRYKGYVEQWISTQGMTDETLAYDIRDRGIDILVDLAGHTMGNRLLVFARKPAPISVSWLGFGYTTGLSAIDYYLTDESCVPFGSEGLFAELPWRIANPAFVYRPGEDMGEVGSLPALTRGYITFGTLSRSIRLNQHTLRLWSEILTALPDSRLIIDSSNFREYELCEQLVARFAAFGISRERLEIGFHTPPWDTLRGIDIGLDCFPHNSGTTLFETLYMGVPYITLAGRPSVGRLGSCILQGVGHPEWITTSENDYLARAIALASDLSRLTEIRSSLRGQIELSPLRDEAGFARKVEQAYRGMWRNWCEQGRES